MGWRRGVGFQIGACLTSVAALDGCEVLGVDRDGDNTPVVTTQPSDPPPLDLDAGSARAEDRFAGARFAGQTIAWWSERLALEKKAGAERFALAKERAARNGLSVTEQGDGVRVDVANAGTRR